jgi:hypothetical protein
LILNRSQKRSPNLGIRDRLIACHGRIVEITRQWESDRGRDSVAASDMNQSLVAWSLPPDRVTVLVSPSAHVVDCSNNPGRVEVSPSDLLPSRITFGPSIPAGWFRSVFDERMR